MTTTLTERAQSFGHLFVERVAKTPNGEAYRYLAGGEWQSLPGLRRRTGCSGSPRG